MDVQTRFRCVMFTPALQVDRFAKALNSSADIALIDLEDSIGWQDKEEARHQALRCLELPRPDNKAVAVRINELTGSCGLQDLDALQTAKQPPDYILLPKIERAHHITFAQTYLLSIGMQVNLIALIETANAVKHVQEIAQASPNLKALLFGSADYVRDIQGEICWDTLLMPRSAIVLAARVAGIHAIDTPYFDIHDEDGLIEDCIRVKKLGFNGRCAIHPKQIAPIQTYFAPSSEAIQRAKDIVVAAQFSNGNVCQVNGEMVGQPIIEAARLLLKNEGIELTENSSEQDVEKGTEHV